jgi:hypothetical protein
MEMTADFEWLVDLNEMCAFAYLAQFEGTMEGPGFECAPKMRCRYQLLRPFSAPPAEPSTIGQAVWTSSLVSGSAAADVP